MRLTGSLTEYEVQLNALEFIFQQNMEEFTFKLTKQMEISIENQGPFAEGLIRLLLKNKGKEWGFIRHGNQIGWETNREDYGDRNPCWNYMSMRRYCKQEAKRF